MTRKQRECLDFIAARLAETRGVPPSFKEIGEHFGYKSKNSVHRLVHALVKQGHLVMIAASTRTLALPTGPGVAIERISQVLARSGNSDAKLQSIAGIIEMMDLPDQGADA